MRKQKLERRSREENIFEERIKKQKRKTGMDKEEHRKEPREPNQDCKEQVGRKEREVSKKKRQEHLPRF